MGKTYEIDGGTDIGMLGLWDPCVPSRPDMSYKEMMGSMVTEARAGQLLFIETGGDGAYRAKVFVEEDPEPGVLRFYRSP